MVAIKELRAGQRKVDVTGQITNIEPARDVDTKKGPGKVANATIFDGTGSVKLSLWNDDIAKAAVGKQVTITNGFVEAYKGVLQISAGLYGKLEIK